MVKHEKKHENKHDKIGRLIEKVLSQGRHHNLDFVNHTQQLYNKRLGEIMEET